MFSLRATTSVYNKYRQWMRGVKTENQNKNIHISLTALET